MSQLTDPAAICEAAIYYVRPDIESMFGLAAFGSPAPFRDVSQCEPGVWAAFCRAMHTFEALARQDIPRKAFGIGERYEGDQDGQVGLLRQAASFLREHPGPTVVDDAVAWIEETPGHFKGIIRDPKHSYLLVWPKDTPEEAIAEARKTLTNARTKHVVFVETKTRCNFNGGMCEATNERWVCKCGWHPPTNDRDLVQAHVDEERRAESSSY